MAKLKSPLFSLDASNSLGKAISFVKRKVGTIAIKRPQPPDARTLAQLSWRTMYQKCSALWHTLSEAEKANWERLARPFHMTGFAYWQSQCLKPNPGIYLPLAGGTMSGDINMANHNISALPDPTFAQDADTKAARDAAINDCLDPIEGKIDLILEDTSTTLEDKLDSLALICTVARGLLIDRLTLLAAGGAGELTAARAGYLDNINNAQLLQITAARLGYIDLLANAINGLAAIKAEVEGLAGAAMRGTDGAALAASWTAGLATILGNFTAARIGYLDNINQAGLLQLTAARAALLDQITAARLAELDAANMPADIDILKASISQATVASDTIRNKNDAEKSTLSGSYVKLKEIKLGVNCAEFRSRFQLKAAGGITAYGRIYKNGVAFGTERATSSATYVEFTEDFTAWVKDVLYQIYCKVSVVGGGNIAYVNQQRMSYEIGIPVTNQDP